VPVPMAYNYEDAEKALLDTYVRARDAGKL